MKNIYQNTADLITIRKIKSGDPGVLINQKRNCIDVEIESLPEIVNELILLMNHKIEATPPQNLSEDELKTWNRIEHVKAAMYHCVVGYDKKLAQKDDDYKASMRENERLLKKIKSIEVIIRDLNAINVPNLKIGDEVTHEDYSDYVFVVSGFSIIDGRLIVHTTGGKNGTWDNPIELITKHKK